jgi:hypothetical protein
LQPALLAVTPSHFFDEKVTDVKTPTCAAPLRLSLAVQVDGAHNVDDEAGWQLPNPSQPLVQVVAEIGQAVSAPTGPALQVPAPFRLQRWQVGQEPVLQQTPLTQLPFAHSAPPLQLWPRGRPTQVPALQIGLFEGHSVLVQQFDARMQALPHAL